MFGGKRSLSYTQVRKMCSRIKGGTCFTENITPIRFRTTVLTGLYDQIKGGRTYNLRYDPALLRQGPGDHQQGRRSC